MQTIPLGRCRRGVRLLTCPPHRGCFRTLPAVNNAGTNTGPHACFPTGVWDSQGVFPGAGFARDRQTDPRGEGGWGDGKGVAEGPVRAGAGPMGTEQSGGVGGRLGGGRPEPGMGTSVRVSTMNE